MKSEWTYRPLGELVSFASGGTPSKKRDDYWGGTIPWISAKTLKTENIDTSDLFITEEGLKAGSKIAPKGSILLLHEEAVFLMEYQLLELKKMWLSIKI